MDGGRGHAGVPKGSRARQYCGVVHTPEARCHTTQHVGLVLARPIHSSLVTQTIAITSGHVGNGRICGSRLSHTPHKPLTADARHSAARHDRESNGDADLTLAADRTIDADVLAMSKSLAHWTTPQKRAPECRVVKCIKAFLFFLQIVVRCGTPRAVPTRTVVPATTMLFSFV